MILCYITLCSLALSFWTLASLCSLFTLFFTLLYDPESITFYFELFCSRSAGCYVQPFGAARLNRDTQ